jgi:hypothetical protein
MKNRRNVVGVSHHGKLVLLDVDRIIAIDCTARQLYFEYTIWYVDDENEFNNVYNAWIGEV